MPENTNTQPTVIKCPHCESDVIWGEQSPFRPFCTERCKLIDFGDWAQEKHKFSSDLIENPDDFIE